MNTYKTLVVGLVIVAVELLGMSLAHADETALVCGAPRLLDAGTVGSHVQVCQVVAVQKGVKPSYYVHAPVAAPTAVATVLASR